MSSPVDLTRAEEAQEQRQPEVRIIVKAPPGAPACRVGKAVSGIDCEAAATCRVVWPDGDRTDACADCAERAKMQAERNHRTTLRVDPIR